MRIIISPAKKMNTDLDSMPWQDLPRFLPRTEVLLDRLHQIRRRLANQGLESPQAYFQAFQAQLTESENKALAQTGGEFAKRLSTLRTKLNDKISDRLAAAIPDATQRRWSQYWIESSEQKDDCVYQLRLMPHHIELPEDFLQLLKKDDPTAAGYWRHV